MKLTHVVKKYGLPTAAIVIALDLTIAAFAVVGGGHLLNKQQQQLNETVEITMPERLAALQSAPDPEGIFVSRAVSFAQNAPTSNDKAGRFD